MTNFAASLCRRLNVKELVTNTPVYRNACDLSGEGLSLVFRRWATKINCRVHKEWERLKTQESWSEEIWWRESYTWKYHCPATWYSFHTLFALKEGWVKFERNKLTGHKWVHVEPEEGHVLHPVYANVAGPELKVAA